MGTTAIEEIADPEQLLHRLNELDRRLSRLELLEASHHQPRQAEIEAANSKDQNPAEVYKDVTVSGYWLNRAVSPHDSESASSALQKTPSEAAHGVFGSVAKAVLGLAGAYMMRVGGESGWLRHSTGVLMAFAYSLTWIIAAGKITNRGQSSPTIYALASRLSSSA